MQACEDATGVAEVDQGLGFRFQIEVVASLWAHALYR